MRKIKCVSSGYSLLEVMVSLVIFSFVMMGATSMLLATMKANKSAGDVTTSYYETQGLIEEVNMRIQVDPVMTQLYLTVTEESGEFVLDLETIDGPVEIVDGVPVSTIPEEDIFFKRSFKLTNPPTDLYLEDRIKGIEAQVISFVGASRQTMTTRTVLLLRN